MVWRTSVEAAPTEKENQNKQKYNKSHLLLLWKWKAQRLPSVASKQIMLVETVVLIWVNVSPSPVFIRRMFWLH
jgi:hypothetical protein